MLSVGIRVAQQHPDPEEQPALLARIVLFEKLQRRHEALDRRHPGVRLFGTQAGLDQPPFGPGISGLPEVVGDLLGVWPGRLLQSLSDPPVPPLAEGKRQLPVERLPDQSVDETQPLAAGNLLDEARLQGTPDRFGQPLVARVANRVPQAERHLLADHRRDRQEPPRLLAQPLQPALYDLSQQRRHPDAARVFENPAFAFPVQDESPLPASAAVRW